MSRCNYLSMQWSKDCLSSIEAPWRIWINNYNDVIISAVASQITGVSIVYSTVGSDADQRKYQSSASVAFVRRIDRWLPHTKASNAENASIWWRHHVNHTDYLGVGVGVGELIMQPKWKSKTLSMFSGIHWWYIKSDTKWSPVCKRHFQIHENCCILIRIPLIYVYNIPIDDNPSLVEIKGRRRTGDKPLSKPKWPILVMHLSLRWRHNDHDSVSNHHLTVVCSTVYSGADQRKHQSSASLAFVQGIHRDRWIPRTKGQLRGKCFHLMTSSCGHSASMS